MPRPKKEHIVKPGHDMKSRRPLTLTKLSFSNRLARLLWGMVWTLLYRPSPVPLHAWRRTLLRLFGARVEKGAHPYPSARIWAPWNLEMLAGSCLSHQVDCYCVDKIKLGRRATVSQYSFLCSASHDHRKRSMPLVTAPIEIGDDAWVTSDVFIGPGVTVGEGAMVGARSTVFRDVPAWTIVAGNPAIEVGRRTLDQD